MAFVGHRRLAGAVLALILVVVFAPVWLPHLVTGGDVGDIPAAVRGAIDAYNEATVLPPGVKAGQFSNSDRQLVRGNIQTNLARHFSSTALTNVLTNVMGWADRIAINPTESRSILYAFIRMDMDTPVTAGNAATVTGTYVMIEKSAWALGDGRTATLGGRYTNRFTYQLERIAGQWFVTAYTDQPVDFVPDPSMESNLDVNPAPEATKAVATERPYTAPPSLRVP
jgi:hypothetical protein